MKKAFLIVVLIADAFSASSQTAVPLILEIQPVFGNKIVQCNDTWFKFNENDSVRFDALRFYISGIELLDGETVCWKEESGFHLVDATVKASLKIMLHNPVSVKFNMIKFNLGIDSITNVSGVLGGDLDPTKGMYWTWQSGYVNFKLEGKSNKCNNRNKEFLFHLGGYQYPENAMRCLTIPVEANPQKIILDLKTFLSGIDLGTQNMVMSPGQPAMKLSDAAMNSIIVRN